MKKGDKVKTPHGPGKLVTQMMNGNWIVALDKPADDGGTWNVRVPEKDIDTGKACATITHHAANKHNPTDKWSVFYKGMRKLIPHVNVRILILAGLHHGPEWYERPQNINITDEEFHRLTDLDAGQAYMNSRPTLLSPVGEYNRATHAHF